MKYVAKYFQAYDDTWAHYRNIDAIERQCQQRLNIEELCSIACKDNYANFENTISPNIILKGFFQSEAQKALQNSQIEKAFEIAENISRPRRENSIAFLTQKRKKS